MTSHLISAPAQIRALAKAVSAAFSASPLSDEERNPGRIDIADMPWVAPPLKTRATLGGVPVSDYLTVPVALDERQLHRFWIKTLDDLWHRPSSAMRRGVFANCAWAMPKVRLGHRAFLFSTPTGYPASLDMTAGALFSIELAHVAAASLPVQDVVSDTDNYYVILSDGTPIGVRNGLVICDSPWDMDVAGMVPDLLETSRGEADYTCRFDQLAMVRSVLHTHRRRFEEFDGIDYALQALRILSLGGHCPELVTEMKLAPLDLPRLRQAERALRDCLATLDDMSISDRSKLSIWHNLLVPEVITASKFKQHIFNGAQFPFSLAQAKLDSIRSWFEEQYKSRIPEAMRQLKTEGEDACNS